ncbi:hypothetical protein [Salinimicrobium oceani]|uniref:Uncharacterized protein n=1 Tax=Salinimicrobium oceani TaxID=2722702 RepID=A0ABX1CUB2_9FLAO|nr:hypothetical protein [Salinimicrobium oceani]NJW51875.1 hypothetical protein [Salinimicrobium oceani]
MKKITLLFILLIITSCTQKEQEQTIIQQIAEANGFENFEDVEELRYTFNVKVNDTLRTSRAWTWNRKTDEVTLTTPDSTVTYNHKTEAAANEKTDQRFINDQYWLLFPFHLVWDEMEWEHSEQATAPISGEQMQRITVTYPDGAGYTPGDMYEIYFKDDHMIREWVYLSGGSREKPFATTWEEYETYKGIAIAKMHKNAEGSFELFFTDVSVK